MSFAAGEGGWIAIAGLGPGDEALVTPEVDAALAAATDVVGYIPYVARVVPRAGLALHPSDNRVELERAAHALELAAQGRRVVVVSSGDPGVFAMASALFEALEAGPAHWRDIDIRVLPASPRCWPLRRVRARRSAMISVRSTCPTISSPGP